MNDFPIGNTQAEASPAKPTNREGILRRLRKIDPRAAKLYNTAFGAVYAVNMTEAQAQESTGLKCSQVGQHRGTAVRKIEITLAIADLQP